MRFGFMQTQVIAFNSWNIWAFSIACFIMLMVTVTISLLVAVLSVRTVLKLVKGIWGVIYGFFAWIGNSVRQCYRNCREDAVYRR